MSEQRSSGCLTRETINAVQAHDLPDAELVYAEEHLRRCKTCAAKAEELREACEDVLDKLKGLDYSDLPLAIDPISDSPDTATQDDQPRPKGRGGMPDIPGYQIIRIVGRGGMGIVYEAVQEKLGRKVALKLLPSVVGSANRNLVQRFRKEATAASKLHHSSIVPIYDFGEARDGYYYAMELLEGRPLSDIIKRIAALDTPLASPTDIAALVGVGETGDSQLAPVGAESRDAEGGAPVANSARTSSTKPGTQGRSSSGRPKLYYYQVAKWIADVGDALHYAHLKQLIHRDVKPSNIMICRDGRVVLVDFGLVKEVGDESVTMTGSLLGTYRYMSPEQIGAKRIKVDARTDVYSLGATLYELLALQPVFGAVEQSELLGQILWREPAAPKKLIPSVPVDLQTICLKALQKSPNERYPTAADMADDLRQFVDDLPIRARPVGWFTRTTKFLRRHPIATGLSAAVCILLVTTATFFFQGRQKDAELAQKSKSLNVADRILSEEQERRIDESLGRAKALWDNDKYETASAIYTEFIERYPHHPDVLKAMINCSYVKKEQFYATRDRKLLEEALELANRALQIDQTKPGAWNAKIIALRGLGRFDDALRTCDLAPRTGYFSYAIPINKGPILAVLGEHDIAIEALQDGIEIAKREGKNPGHLPYRNQSAILAAHNEPLAWGLLDDALASKHGKTNESIEGHRAMMRLTLVEHMDAKAALEDAFAADRMAEYPMAGIRQVLALARYRNGDFDQAVVAAQSAIELGFDSDALTRLILAASQAKLGRMAEAEAAFKEAMKVDTNSDGDGTCQLESKWLWCYPKSVVTELRSEVEQLLSVESE